VKSYLAEDVLLSGFTWQELYCCQGLPDRSYCCEALRKEFPGMNYMYLTGASLLRRATRQELYFCQGLPGRSCTFVRGSWQEMYYCQGAT
jgi:hypothetical protein